MTDPLHQSDKEIDRALGKDWPDKSAVTQEESDQVRLCLSREEAEKAAEAWLANYGSFPPVVHSAVMAFIRDTYPVAREAGS